MYFRVGRSIGFFETGEKGVLTSKVELQNRSVMVDIISTNVWFHLGSTSSDDEAVTTTSSILEQFRMKPKDKNATLAVLSLLVKHGIALHAHSLTELYNLAKGLLLVRNGIAVFDEEVIRTSQELKHILLLADERFPISSEQFDIWQLSNGKRTLEEIRNNHYAHTDTAVFMNNVFVLSGELLVFAI